MGRPTADAHVHVVGPDDARYPRQPTGAGSTWWHHPNGAEELIASLDAGEVERAVVVQAVGVYGYDCRYAADVAASNGRFAFVGAIDMAAADVGDEFDRLSGTTDLAGVRLFGVGAAGADWLTDGAGDVVFQRAAGHGCVVVPTIFPDALPELRPLIERHPDVTVALDHCAFPDLGGPGAIRHLLDMADLPRLHLKVTSHNLDADDDPAVFLGTLVDAFGSERVSWGSDHPQHQAMTYLELADLAARAARNLTPDQQASFLGGNALRLWWPSPSTEPHHAPTIRGAP